MRVRTLPTIKNKESALRMEVKRSKDEVKTLELRLEEQMKKYDNMVVLWNEFDPTLLSVKDVKLGTRKIAGVRIPLIEDIIFEIKPFSYFSSPQWFADGIMLIQDLAKIGIERALCEKKLSLLEHARKKTTQKVNLFEKVQIPGYQDAIRKIKRFMEDEENLSKSSQKIMRSHQMNAMKMEEQV